MKAITHPHYRAEALQEARRLRFKASCIRKDDGKAIDHKVTAAFALLSVGESARLWQLERDAFARLFEDAAALLEAGVGGVDQLLLEPERASDQDVSARGPR